MSDQLLSEESFSKAFDSLQPRNKEVLLELLRRKTDKEIAQTLGLKDDASVRKYISLVCKAFGLSGSHGRAKRADLVALFAKYRPDLLGTPHQPIDAPQTVNNRLLEKTQEYLEEAPDVAAFYGRIDELKTLKKWLVEDRCGLISVLGIGGIGKSTLTAKLVSLEAVRDEFDFIIWRSLREAPPVERILLDCIKVLSNQQDLEMPVELVESVKKLIYYLQTNRCLLVLDNVESILKSGEQTGHYREGYEGYKTLLQKVGESSHHSCLIITSREKPKEIAMLEGFNRLVRSFPLQGLEENAGQEIFKSEKLFITDSSEWRVVFDRYQGNPLALKIAATNIRSLYSGNVTEFLTQGSTLFGDIRDVLEEQFKRLSNNEKSVVYWLAINREPVKLNDLQEDLLSPVKYLQNTLESLQKRSLIERVEEGFTLQNVVMEYVTDRFVEEIKNELETGKFELFNSHTLIKSTAKDYVRDAQIRLILRQVVDGLRNIEERLKVSLQNLQNRFEVIPGYAAGNLLNLFCQCQIDLSGCDFSHFTIWQAYLQGTQLHDVKFKYSDFAKSLFAETLGSISSVAFHPDGKLLATGDADDEICLWHVKDSKSCIPYRGHAMRVRTVAFSPDKRTLASGSDDKTVRLWDVQTGEYRKVLKDHTSGVWTVAFSPNGHILASGSDDRTVRLWDVETGECLKVLQQHADRVWTVAFSPKGHILASGSEDETVKLWDVETGECLKTLQALNGCVRTVAFSPDGRMLASGGDDQTVKLWDVKTGQCLKTLESHTNWIRSVAFSPDKRTLASGSDDQTVKLWSVQTGECLKTLQGHTSRVWSVAFSCDERTIASGSDDQTAKLWDVKTGQCLRTIEGRANRVWSVAFAPQNDSDNSSGLTLASGSDDRNVRLWDIQTGQCRILQGHTNRVWSVAFSPDGHTLASSSDDKTVKLWHVRTGECLKTLLAQTSQGYTSCVRSVAFSHHNSDVLAGASDDQTVILWDAKAGRRKKTLQGHTSQVRSVAFSPDDTMVASGSEDETVKLWNVHTGECLKTLKGHTSWVWSVAFSSDGTWLASGSDDKTIKLWNVHTGECLKTLEGHTSRVWSVAFSSDGHVLVSGSDDQTMKLWDVYTGECRKTLQGHTSWVRSVAFSPDDTMVASGSENEAIKLWDVKQGKWLKDLKIERLYERMNITGVKGLTPEEKATLRDLGAVEE